MRTDKARAQRSMVLAYALLCAVVGAFLVWVSWGSFRHLFGGYRDSPVLTYVAFGGLCLIPGSGLLVWAWRVLRPRRSEPVPPLPEPPDGAATRHG